MRVKRRIFLKRSKKGNTWAVGLKAVRQEVPNEEARGRSCCIPDLSVSGYGYYLLPYFPEKKNDIIWYFLGWLASPHSDEFLYVCIEAVGVWVSSSMASQALLVVFTVRTPCIWRSHRIWVRSNTVKSRFCCAALWIQEWALKLACLLAARKGLVVTYHASHVSSFCTVSREGINISLYSNSCILVYAQILQLSPAFCLLGKYLCLTGWRTGELV